MNLVKSRLWTVIILISGLSSGQYISVDENYTVAQLVSEVLVNSSCAETSNYKSYPDGNFSVYSVGYFNAEDSNFEYAEGIIISTGQAIDAVGPNDEIKSTGTIEWPGDDDLLEITRIPELYNASYIEFDFIPKSNSISFNYLFASEEYSEAYQCEYSDVFAFILTDSNGKSTNLALVPDSNDRVSATSIRPGVPDICQPSNEEYFGQRNGSRSSISMTGQTESLTAKSEVIPGETYTIKLVIADNLDTILDSAVFLEAGSFSIDVSLGDDRTVDNRNPLCMGETYELNASSVDAQHYRWFKDGVQLTQFDNVETITVSENGEYSVEVEFSPQCISRGRIALEFIAHPTIAEEPLDIAFCFFDESEIPRVDLTSNSQRILGNQDAEIYDVYYFKNMSDAENFVNIISNPSFFVTRESETTIYARISSGASCFEISSFKALLQDLDFSTNIKEEYLLCLDSDGHPIEPKPKIATGLPSEEYSFVWFNGPPSTENTLANETDASITVEESGNYYVEITNLEFGCSTVRSTEVLSSEPPNRFEVLILSDIFSREGKVELLVEGNSEYRYSVDDLDFSDNPIFKGLEAGEHEAFVTDIYGCTVVSEPFLLLDYPRFFTPNGDGVNDIWNISGLSILDSPKIRVYDRYGNLLHEINNDIGWDGTNNGERVPSSDYWFKITYNNSFGEAKEFKSHFTLKR